MAPSAGAGVAAVTVVVVVTDDLVAGNWRAVVAKLERRRYCRLKWRK